MAIVEGKWVHVYLNAQTEREFTRLDRAVVNYLSARAEWMAGNATVFEQLEAYSNLLRVEDKIK